MRPTENPGTIIKVLFTVCTQKHQNDLVATHANGHMICGYALLVPVNEITAQPAEQLCPSLSTLCFVDHL